MCKQNQLFNKSMHACKLDEMLASYLLFFFLLTHKWVNSLLEDVVTKKGIESILNFKRIFFLLLDYL